MLCPALLHTSPCDMPSLRSALRHPCVNSALARRRNVGGTAKRRKLQQECGASGLAAPAALVPEGWPLWAALAAIAAAAQVTERRTPLGSVVSSPVAGMGIALVASAAGLIPTSAPAYDAVWAYLMPLAAALCLLETDLRRLKGSAGPTLAAFAVGAVGTVLGTFAAWTAVGARLGPAGWKVAAALCASYIGGSVNMAAVAAALAVPGPALASAMAADNVAMAAYIAVLMGLAKKAEWREESAEEGRAGAGPRQSAPTAESVSLALAAAALACACGDALAARIGFSSGSLAVMALLAAGLASAGGVISGRSRGGGSAAPASPFAGADAAGSALMTVFFVCIGAGAGGVRALRGSGWLLVFILLQLGVHLGVCLGGGRLLRLPLAAVLVASNANVGGPATAAAMATARRWEGLVQPALLTGALGYAIATGIGLAVAGVLRRAAGAA